MYKTIDYLIDDDGSVVWPSATNIYFLVKFPSVLISIIMYTLMFSYPGLIYPFLVSLGLTPSSLPNTIQVFSISFVIYLVQN